MPQNFNKFFLWMWEYAQSIGLNKGRWMAKSGINKQRFAEFATAAGLRDGRRSKPISPYYFINLVQGLGLDIDDVEKISKIKFLNGKRKVRKRTKDKSPKVLSDEVYIGETKNADESQLEAVKRENAYLRGQLHMLIKIYERDTGKKFDDD